ncbi:MAG: T9SS type A sorting domain-containing protein [Flavobacteriales bacterium]
MFIPRHLLLYAAIAATFTATAQEMLERRGTRTVEVREVEGTTVVTIVTNADEATNTQVMAGDEALAWLAANDEDVVGVKEAHVRTSPCDPGSALAVPALCQVIIRTNHKEAGQDGGQKAEVFRYRYKPKPNNANVHTMVGNPDDGGVDKLATANDAQAGSDRRGALSSDDLRVLPNPSSGLFTLAFPLPDEGGSGELYITDAAGRVVYRETVMGSGGQARTVDLRNRGKGTYVATVVLGENTISKRLVIE